MGYLKINTERDGEIIIDASRVMYVRSYDSGMVIDFITDLGPSEDKAQIRLNGTNLDKSTKRKFNQAIIDAQLDAFVVVRPSGNEVFQSVSLDPA